jgi:DNA-binding NtrC family response regulator
MSTHKLLLLAENSSLLSECEWTDDFDIIRVAVVPAAVEVIASGRIDCALVIGKFSGYASLSILEAFNGADPRVRVVFWAETMTAAEAVSLVRSGASHCFGAHDCPNALHDHVERMCLESRHRKQQSKHSDLPWRNWFIGTSRAMDDVFNTISLVGPRRCTVLISGETGTGKEIAARALHAVSPRAHLPMVALNCSAVPENLLESELFGHVKGAFTGAVASRPGKFEQAHKSTLFLDEIGDMPMELQAKLLRVLQEREVERLGSGETIRVDVRVIAASNYDLLARVRQGKFREDLYYRLNVVPLRMPPLRERRRDVPMLVDHFVAKVCRAEGLAEKSVPPEVKDRLCDLPWPGNVRQLENLVEATIALSGDREVLTAADFGLVAPRPMKIEASISEESMPEPIDFQRAVTEFERSLLERALVKAGGNKTAAASLLGLKRTTLIMKIRGFDQDSALLAEAV